MRPYHKIRLLKRNNSMFSVNGHSASLKGSSHRSRSAFHERRELDVKPGASLQVLSRDEVLVAMRAGRERAALRS